MSINIGPPQVDELRPRIAVIGVGGAGGNAIANMIAAKVEGVDFIVANTDAQALNASPAELRIQLGPDITQGLGAGSRPEVGRAAAEETIAQVEAALEGAHMCFVAAGMGGGTGTGAAPVIAKAARDRGILTVGVVTKPFTFEGSRRTRSADSGIEELQKNVDTLIVIPNQNLFLVANPNTTFKEAFLLADEVLQQGVRGITDLMVMPGLINLDFADVRSVMHEMGKAMMGTGEAEGDGRALEAAEKAISNPLLDGVSMKGARGVIISITGGEDMRLMEVDEAANHIRELVDPDANIIWGSAFNNNLEGRIRVSVVATGIDNDGHAAAEPSRAFSLEQPQVVPSVVEEDEPMALSGMEADETEAEADSDHGDTLDLTDSFSAQEDHEEDAVSNDIEDDDVDIIASDDMSGSEEDELVLGDVAEEEAQPGMAENGRFAMPGSGNTDAAGDAEEQAQEDAPPAPRVASGGGTLFERMSNLTRGGAKSDEDASDDEDGEDGDPLDIPRFLNRQNNS